MGYVKIKHPPRDVDICPECGSDKITNYDSRNTLGYRKRSKKCRDCGYRYGTVEVVATEWVDLKDGLDSYETGFRDGKMEAIKIGSEMVRLAMQKERG